MLESLPAQLPDLHKDRHVFSFANGIYLAKQDTFVRYGTPDASRLPQDLVSSRFFDLDFPEAMWAERDAPFSDVPTPHLQSIMDFQGMSPEVARWMYVMIGRLVYEVNEMDGWQVRHPRTLGEGTGGDQTRCRCREMA